MKNKNSNIFPLLTGLVIGGAAAYFLKSKKGQKIIDVAIKNGDNLKTAVIDNSKDIIESSQQAIDKAIVSSKENFTELADGAKDFFSSKAENIDESLQKAKREIERATS